MKGLLFFFFIFFVLYLIGKPKMADIRRKTDYGFVSRKVESILTDEERVNKVLDDLKKNNGKPPKHKQAWQGDWDE